MHFDIDAQWVVELIVLIFLVGYVVLLYAHILTKVIARAWHRQKRQYMERLFKGEESNGNEE